MNCTETGADFDPNGDIVEIGVGYLYKNARVG